MFSGAKQIAAQEGAALTFLAVAIAAAFLAFVPTAYVGLSELGLIAGAGMFIALTATGIFGTMLERRGAVVQQGAAAWKRSVDVSTLAEQQRY